MKAAQIKAKIISNQRLSGNYWHLEFESGLIAKYAVAGQFVNIRVTDGPAPLLRRPISIHGAKAGKVKIIYEIIGEGTRALSGKKPGEFLDVIGPLGNGFIYPRPAESRGVKNILIAGGIGVAPLAFLAEKLKKTKPLVLIGARTKKEILCTREFKALGCALKLATDDGSLGFKGRVTDLFKIILEQAKPTQVFSCGPHLMLKAVAEIVNEYKINAQLSLEEHMACGLGACLGCAVATKAGYKTVCKDGPVFSGEELIW
ncbi:MAG: dihydroorotate dehydrogenase electron transfer subunit [Candidatus Omnitrophota bacterium]|nr:dihydroorotate dehydrogenase electron transfer subunit [Candidatus Omnitrophota bacterium]